MPLLGKPNIEKLEAKKKIKQLVKALEYGSISEGSNIRVAAVEALGRVGDASAIEALVDATMAFYPDVRTAARKELAKVGAPAVDPLIALLKGDVEAQVRHSKGYAADALVEIGTPAVESLVAALIDDNRRTREAAAKALGEIGDARAVEPLVLALEDGSCRKAAAKALATIGDVRAVEPLAHKLGTTCDEAVAEALLNLLAQEGKSPSVWQHAIDTLEWCRAIEWGKLTFSLEWPEGDAVCSDNMCPCQEEVIPRGSGYLYISQEAADFRSDARTLQEAQKKMKHLKQQMGGAVFFSVGAITPILMCRQAAELRGLDLAVAAQDARYWWGTGRVPLRKTSLADEDPTRRHPKPILKPLGREASTRLGGGGTPSGIARETTVHPASTDIKGAFLFEVSATFTIKGKGLVAVGHVKSGTITPGEVIAIASSTEALMAKVVELQMHGKQLAKAGVGEEVGLILEGIDSPVGTDQVKAGMIVQSPKAFSR
jgi:HEAT repeat protein